MNKYLVLITALVVSGFSSIAQVGIGTSSPVSSAQLQVESSNKGFLPPRVALTGVDDTTTISSPATGLVIYNTATAGAGASSITPGLYNFHGGVWERLNNNASASSVANVLGVISNTGIMSSSSIIVFDPCETFNTGSYIDLPPGRWEIEVGVNLTTVTTWPYGGDATWLRAYFIDASTTLPSITGNFQEVGTADYMDNNICMEGLVGGYINGKVHIQNTGTSTKTYYLYLGQRHEDYTAWHGIMNDNRHIDLNGTGGAKQGNNYIVAYPF